MQTVHAWWSRKMAQECGYLLMKSRTGRPVKVTATNSPGAQKSRMGLKWEDLIYVGRVISHREGGIIKRVKALGTVYSVMEAMNEADEFMDPMMGDEDEEDFYEGHQMDEEERMDLGPCCICEKDNGTVRNLVSLHHPAPVPGTGWGCVQCGLPSNGATAVVCDPCIERMQAEKIDVKFVIDGYPLHKKRFPREKLSKERFDHDMAKHPEETSKWN